MLFKKNRSPQRDHETPSDLGTNGLTQILKMPSAFTSAAYVQVHFRLDLRIEFHI